MNDEGSRGSVVDLFARFDAARFGVWGEAMKQALEPIELGERTGAVLQVTLDTMTHPSAAIIEKHVNDALDAGSSIAELIEASLQAGWLESGAHGLHDGLEALEMVVRARESKGLASPLVGAELTPEEREPEAPWPVPAVLPYQTPTPRLFRQVLVRYDPDLFAAWNAWNDARIGLRRALTRKTQDFIFVALDVAIYWPEPLLDHYMHSAFEAGATAQELLEVIMLVSRGVQGARTTNIAGRPLEGGVYAIHHGLAALDRVLEQRESHGLLAPRDRTKPRVGPKSLPVTAGAGAAGTLDRGF